MNANEYQKLAERTECDEQAAAERRRAVDINNMLLGTRLIHAAFGLASEVGEFTDALKKSFYYGQPLDISNLKEELGDCLWYIALACNALGIDLENVMEENIAKLKSRYPEKFTEEDAREENRDRQAEARAMKENDA